MKTGELIVNGVSEFAPIITFVIASEMVGFMPAIVWLVSVAVFVLLLEWFVSRRVPKFGLLASCIILFFGGLSYITDNELFIILKDTLYALLFAAVLAGGLYFNKIYLRNLFSDYFAMTERGWRILTQRWIIWFLIIGIGNEIARASFTPELWVYYKFLAVFCTWVFGFYQFTLARRERLPEANEWGLKIRVAAAGTIKS